MSAHISINIYIYIHMKITYSHMISWMSLHIPVIRLSLRSNGPNPELNISLRIPRTPTCLYISPHIATCCYISLHINTYRHKPLYHILYIIAKTKNLRSQIPFRLHQDPRPAGPMSKVPIVVYRSIWGG